jgi:hypothetical protein
MREPPSRSTAAWRVLSNFKNRVNPLRDPLATQKTKESTLADLAKQLGHVYAAAQNGEPVTFWLILNEQTTSRSVRLACTRTAQSGKQTYAYSKTFRWDATDPEIIDTKERIGFKALCHLIQATGLPFLGVNSPLSPEINGMEALLSSSRTWMLNIPVFLQCHQGPHETIRRPEGKQRSVRGQFEKLKALAPEHFAHLQFPSGSEMH